MPKQTSAPRIMTAPTANSAIVRPETLPVVGSTQCFTPTTESPSIAATSTDVRPPCSSTWPAIMFEKPLGAVIAGPNGLAEASGALMPIGAGMPGGGRTAGGAACMGALGAGAVGSAGAGPLPGRDAAMAGAAGGGGAEAGIVIAIADGADGVAGRGVEAITSIGGADGAAALPASSSSDVPMESSMRVSPTTIVSPDCSLALLTFELLTKVPFVDPRSMMLTSLGPLTSMIACMRLTVSSSSLRWAEGTLPSLMTLSDSFSSRRNWSPL